MRILILCEGDAETWDSWSGISRSVVDHLRADGHEVVCGDVELYGAARYAVAARSFAVDRRRWAMRYRLGPAGFAARSARAQRIVNAHAGRVDVVMQFGATFTAKVPPGLPLVLYCDSNFEYSRDGARSGFSEASALRDRDALGVRAREARIYEQASRIFTLSERLRTVFIDRFGIPADRVETVFAGANLGLDVGGAVPVRHDRAEPVILFAGRAFARKGGFLMLDAFALVRSRIPDARLMVVGPERLPGGAEVPEGVELLGFIDKSTPEGRGRLLDAYARARVFCLPTKFEAFGIVYLEAMYFELPCIGPRQWAVPEIIEDGVTGLVVTPDDPETLAGALIDLLSDPARADAMGRAGKARLESRFTWPLVVRRMTRSVEQLRAAR